MSFPSSLGLERERERSAPSRPSALERERERERSVVFGLSWGEKGERRLSEKTIADDDVERRRKNFFYFYQNRQFLFLPSRSSPLASGLLL